MLGDVATTTHFKHSFQSFGGVSGLRGFGKCAEWRQALLLCFGLSVERAAMQMCLTVRNYCELSRGNGTQRSGGLCSAFIK